MLNYAHKFYKLRGAERSFFIRAYFLGIIYSVYVLIFPKRIIFNGLGLKDVESEFKLFEDQRKIVLLVEKTMRRVIRFLPLRIKCFARALTARRILKKYNITSTIYFGIGKEGNSKFIAHAWLRCGDVIVTGKENMNRFTPILYFS